MRRYRSVCIYKKCQPSVCYEPLKFRLKNYSKVIWQCHLTHWFKTLMLSLQLRTKENLWTVYQNSQFTNKCNMVFAFQCAACFYTLYTCKNYVHGQNLSSPSICYKKLSLEWQTSIPFIIKIVVIFIIKNLYVCAKFWWRFLLTVGHVWQEALKEPKKPAEVPKSRCAWGLSEVRI